MPRETRRARLVEKICLSESAQCFHFDFQIEGIESFDFTPGQFISTVAVDPNGKSQTRAYSIASAPRTNHFDLCVNRVEGGFFSNHLADLAVGDTLDVHGPYGAFVMKQPLTDAIFVATGTGIAPMRSFTEWLFPENGPDRSKGKHFWCVYGTRHEPDLYYADYFEAVAARHPNFHYINTLSRSRPDWTGNTGYVQQYVEQIVNQRGGGVSVPDGTPSSELPDFGIYTYICGLNNMVSSVRDLLTSRGWHKKQVVFERYD